MKNGGDTNREPTDIRGPRRDTVNGSAQTTKTSTVCPSSLRHKGQNTYSAADCVHQRHPSKTEAAVPERLAGDRHLRRESHQCSASPPEDRADGRLPDTLTWPASSQHPDHFTGKPQTNTLRNTGAKDQQNVTDQIQQRMEELQTVAEPLGTPRSSCA